MKEQKKKRTLLWVSGILIFLVCTAAAFPLVVSWRYERVIEQKLPEWIARATDSMYVVTVADVEINMLTKNLTVTGIQLTPDPVKVKELKMQQKMPPAVFTVGIERMEADGIKWANIVADKELNCRTLTISTPQIYVNKPHKNETLNRDSVPAQQTKTAPKVNIGVINIVNPDIIYRDFGQADSLAVYLKGGSIALKNWVYNSDVSINHGKLLYASGGTMHFDSLVLKRKGSYYSVRTGNISFVTTANSFEIKNLKFTPALSHEEYYREIGEQDEILTVDFPSIKINGFDWSKLIAKGEMVAKSVLVDSPTVQVYISRLPPPAALKKRKYPVQLLQSLPLQVYIEELKINSGAVSYTEKNVNTKLEGTIPFKNLNATIRNITNIKHRISAKPTCTVSAKGELFESTMGMEIVFPLTDTVGSFSLTGYQTPLDGTKLNEITRPLAKMEFQSMEMKKMSISFRCDGRRTSGKFLFLYDDLKLSILDHNDEGALAKKGFSSFVINKALLYPQNPMEGEPVREINLALTRDVHKSFFNLLWMSLRSGALLTAGRNPKVATMMTQKKG